MGKLFAKGVSSIKFSLSLVKKPSTTMPTVFVMLAVGGSPDVFHVTVCCEPACQTVFEFGTRIGGSTTSLAAKGIAVTLIERKRATNTYKIEANMMGIKVRAGDK